uniref:FYVE-type domain-containing protein n=1 Tax=Varanus komodoensis TaxID=61221 RepID=A0A8D2LJU5_VARKO
PLMKALYEATHALFSPQTLCHPFCHCTKNILKLLCCVWAGVADQLQTNFASDLRAILKSVFKIVTTQMEEVERTHTKTILTATLRNCKINHIIKIIWELKTKTKVFIRDGLMPPDWVPDSTCSHCMACQAPFTFLRRRHHCRSCGKIFCSRCSSHLAPLPHFRQLNPVRVCTHCYTTHLPSTSKNDHCL